MKRRGLAAAALFAAAALAVVPTGAGAVPIGRTASIDIKDKAPAQFPVASTIGESLIRHEAPAQQSDKAVLIERTTLVLIRDEAGISAQLVSEIYLVFVDGDLYQVAAIAAAPELCAIPACEQLPRETIAEVADRARMSIERQQESGKHTISSSGFVGKASAKEAVEHVSLADSKAEEIEAAPAGEMNPAKPWWSEWLSPTTVIGLTGTLIAGLTGWFAIAHQRYQIRLAQAAAAASNPVGAGLSSKPRPRPQRRSTTGGSESGTPSSA